MIPKTAMEIKYAAKIKIVELDSFLRYLENPNANIAAVVDNNPINVSSKSRLLCALIIRLSVKPAKKPVLVSKYDVTTIGTTAIGIKYFAELYCKTKDETIITNKMVEKMINIIFRSVQILRR